MTDDEIHIEKIEPNSSILKNLGKSRGPNIWNHIDIPSEEDAIMKYNPIEDQGHSEIEKLISALNDRKQTCKSILRILNLDIGKFKGPDYIVEENKVEALLGGEFGTNPLKFHLNFPL